MSNDDPVARTGRYVEYREEVSWELTNLINPFESQSGDDFWEILRHLLDRYKKERDCDKNLSNLFGDEGAYFFDNTFWEWDKIAGKRPHQGTARDSHLYGSETNTKVSTNIYVPAGFQPLVPTKNLFNTPTSRNRGNKFIGREDDSDGNYLQNYVMFYNPDSNLTLVIWHVDDYGVREVGGRTRIGKIGFSDESGGVFKGGGHSHFDLFSGRRPSIPAAANKPKFRRSFRELCP